MKSPLSCHYQDYLEIACMFSYKVDVLTDDQRSFRGQAIDLSNQNHEEHLHLELPSGQIVKLPIHQLMSLQVLSANPRFDKIDFKHD